MHLPIHAIISTGILVMSLLRLGHEWISAAYGFVLMSLIIYTKFNVGLADLCR